MLLNLIFIIILVTSFITDLKYQKIYNKVIFPGVIISVLLHFISNGIDGFKLSMMGLGVGFVILLIPYFLGGIGAGDVKLLAFIGGLKGSYFVINTALYMGLIGGVMALIVILSHKDSLKFIKRVITWGLLFLIGIRGKLDQPNEILLKRYPYGIAIVGGAFICLIFRGAWLI